MKLIHLRLRDFRQFRGEQLVEFSPAGDQNITAIHGFNGSGKTALLNAFVWCFYGQTTPDLGDKERMVNDLTAAQLLPGKSCEVFVEVKFSDYRGEIFVAKRSTLVSRSSDGKLVQDPGELSLGVHRESGEYEKLSGPQLHINRLLPEELYPFFFFNGERVEKLAGRDAYDQVEGGVKTLLNVEIFERSLRDLRRNVLKDLAKELREYGDEDLQDALARQLKLQGEQSELKEQIGVHRASVAACDEEIERIDQKQHSIVHLSELIERRRGLESHLEGIARDKNDCELGQKEALSKDGYLAFCESVLNETQQLVAEARQKGELPAKVKPQFVDDLLAKRKCICNRPIEEGSPEETSLVEWRECTGLAAYEEAISQTSAGIRSLRARREDYFKRIDALRERLDGLISARRRLIDELAEVKQLIGDRSIDEESSALESQRSKALDQKTEALQKAKELEAQLGEVELHLGELERVIDKLDARDEKGRIIKRQLDSVQRVASALERICELQKQDVRRSLDHQISEIWRDAAVKSYTASISEDFRLELHKVVGGSLQPVHGASTGEKQVLALSFVGALVKKAKENVLRSPEHKDQKGLFVGGEYPLVMDSPFGSLEPEYQRKVAEWIPNLAGQVIVMASKSQWTADVEKAMRKRIGKEYILELYTPKDGVAQTISILGADWPYVVKSDSELEETLIREVK